MRDERAALERAIANDPDSLDNFTVLANWILAHEPEDPRGELISLMLAHDASRSDRPRLRVDIDAVFARHTEPLLGKLAPHMQNFEVPPLEWRAGYIRRIELRDIPKLDEILELALEHESGKFVREIAITNGSLPAIARALVTITKQPRPSLRSFAIDSIAKLGFLDALWTVAPGLEHLELRVNFDVREPIVLPAVQLATFVGPFSPTTLQAITTAKMPNVSQLRITFTGERARFANLEPLFTRKDLPELRYLALNNFEGLEPDLVRRLVRAPWLGQLVALDLAGNAIRDFEAELLARAAPRFREDIALTIATEAMTETGKIALRVLDPKFAQS